jgi:hypothetical protein
MDTEFRRIFFNLNEELDGLPIVSILYVSQTAVDYADGTVTFVGTGRDYDRNGEGITSYKWTSDLDGVLSLDQTASLTVSNLSTGLHTISFTAQDDEGNWAKDKTFTLFVAEELSQIYLPAITK